MNLETIATRNAPAAIGPYSQAIRVGDFIFCSGQIPLDPQSGQIVGDGIAEQTHQVMRNLAAVLEAAGTSLDRVVKTTVYLHNLDDFAEMNEVYGEYFTATKPARATIQTAQLPRGSLVEIDVIAVR